MSDAVFGAGHKVHPITKMPLETGIGALPHDLQAELVHIPAIRAKEGHAAADAMLKALKNKKPEAEPGGNETPQHRAALRAGAGGSPVLQHEDLAAAKPNDPFKPAFTRVT